MTSQDLVLAAELGVVARPIGRPLSYSEEIADEIIRLMAEEGKSLRSVCSIEGMPSAVTVYNWFEKKPEFLKRYTQAREQRADAIFEETLEIADDGRNDWIEDRDPANPGYVANGEHIQRSRLRVDTRKWFLSKLFPGRFADQAPAVSVQTNVLAFTGNAEGKLADLLKRKAPETIEGKVSHAP